MASRNAQDSKSLVNNVAQEPQSWAPGMSFFSTFHIIAVELSSNNLQDSKSLVKTVSQEPHLWLPGTSKTAKVL